MTDTDTNTKPYHIRNADTVIRKFVNTELNTTQTFTDEGEPIIEVNGEPLTRQHIDEALTTAFNNTPKQPPSENSEYHIATIKRRIGNTEITQQHPFTLPETTNIDPITAVKNYYAGFWGENTEQSPRDENTFTSPDGGETAEIISVASVPEHHYETLTTYLTELTI